MSICQPFLTTKKGGGARDVGDSVVGKRHGSFVDLNVVREFKKRHLSHKIKGGPKHEKGKSLGCVLGKSNVCTVRTILLTEPVGSSVVEGKAKTEKKKHTSDTTAVEKKV